MIHPVKQTGPQRALCQKRKETKNKLLLCCCPDRNYNNGNVTFFLSVFKNINKKKIRKEFFRIWNIIMGSTDKSDMDRIGLFKEMEYVTIKDPYKEPASCKF